MWKITVSAEKELITQFESRSRIMFMMAYAMNKRLLSSGDPEHTEQSTAQPDGTAWAVIRDTNQVTKSLAPGAREPSADLMPLKHRGDCSYSGVHRTLPVWTGRSMDPPHHPSPDSAIEKLLQSNSTLSSSEKTEKSAGESEGRHLVSDHLRGGEQYQYF